MVTFAVHCETVLSGPQANPQGPVTSPPPDSVTWRDQVWVPAFPPPPQLMPPLPSPVRANAKMPSGFWHGPWAESAHLAGGGVKRAELTLVGWSMTTRHVGPYPTQAPVQLSDVVQSTAAEHEIVVSVGGTPGSPNVHMWQSSIEGVVIVVVAVVPAVVVVRVQMWQYSSEGVVVEVVAVVVVVAVAVAVVAVVAVPVAVVTVGRIRRASGRVRCASPLKISD